MRIGIATGHTQNTNIKERLWEWEVCIRAQDQLVKLLDAAERDVVTPPHSVYDLANGAGLRQKVKCFNEAGALDLAVELHINGGGGDYSTCLYWGNGKTHSHKGRLIAENICEQFKVSLCWRSIGARTQHYMGRDLYFLNKCKAVAVIPEPGFKDHPKHRPYLNTPAFSTLYATTTFAAIEAYRRGLQ